MTGASWLPSSSNLRPIQACEKSLTARNDSACLKNRRKPTRNRRSNTRKERSLSVRVRERTEKDSETREARAGPDVMPPTKL